MIRDFYKKINHYYLSLYYLWLSLDPGHFRFKLAGKALVVTLATIAIGDYCLDKVGMVVATLMAALSLLCTQGKTLRQQQATFLLCMATLLLMLGLSSVLKIYPLASGIVLVIGAFLAFYLRRFGEQYFAFPIMGLVIYLVVSVFPLADLAMTALIGLLSMTLGGLMYFYIFPNRLQGQEKHYFALIFYHCWRLAVQLKQGIEKNWPSQAVASHYFERLKSRLVPIETILKNQKTIMLGKAIQHPNEEALLMDLYGLTRVLELLLDNLQQLMSADCRVFKIVKGEVVNIVVTLEALLFALERRLSGQVLDQVSDQVSGQDDDSMLQGNVLETAAKALLQKVYDPNIEMGTALIFYSNIAFGAHRVEMLIKRIMSVLVKL